MQPGTVVYYSSIIGEPHDGVRRIVRYVDSERGLAWLRGYSGCVAVDALTVAEHQGQHADCPGCDTNLCLGGCGRNLGPYEECNCTSGGS